MYYILNGTNKVIAADDSLLELCGVKHIDELSTKIAKEDITFDMLSDKSINLTLDNNEETYTISKIILSSMLGDLTLIQVQTEEVESLILSESEDKEPITDFSDDDLSSLTTMKTEEEIPELEETDYTNLLLDDTTISINTEETTTEEASLSLATDTISIIEDTEEKDSLGLDTDSIELFDDSELFNLNLDETEAKNTIEDTINIDLKDDDLLLDTPKVIESEEIIIDVESISKKIGISSDDYSTFLNDFIDTALSQEKDLQSSDTQKRTDAIYTLSHLSNVLHLPSIGKILTNINLSEDDTRREVVESFYTTLAQITTNPTENISIEMLDHTETIDTLEITEKSIDTEKERNSNSFGTISLEGITPKHFDFQLEEAANDLSLPVALIEEFVHDFIDQAHIETKKMLQAYEDGDLDAIQKIGHLLKGASSNLRINALADTLYQIQFCEDPSKLERYIKDYWAHFLSFENQINVISN